MTSEKSTVIKEAKERLARAKEINDEQRARYWSAYLDGARAQNQEFRDMCMVAFDAGHEEAMKAAADIERILNSMPEDKKRLYFDIPIYGVLFGKDGECCADHE